MNVLYWPSIINYQLLPPQCPILTHYTASSSRNAQLSQLDLVSTFIWTNYKFRGHLGEIEYCNSIENTWQVPFPLPPAQTVFASKTSPFSSTFFLQALLVAIGTWCGSTLNELGLWQPSRRVVHTLAMAFGTVILGMCSNTRTHILT